MVSVNKSTDPQQGQVLLLNHSLVELGSVGMILWFPTRSWFQIFSDEPDPNSDPDSWSRSLIFNPSQVFCFWKILLSTRAFESIRCFDIWQILMAPADLIKHVCWIHCKTVVRKSHYEVYERWFCSKCYGVTCINPNSCRLSTSIQKNKKIKKKNRDQYG